MEDKTNLNYPAFPTDTYKLHDHVYVKSDYSYYKYGGIARISNIPDHCSGFDLQDGYLNTFHVEEDNIIRLATPKEIKHYEREVEFQIELRYIDNSM
jgi:hypothetical protein